MNITPSYWNLPIILQGDKLWRYVVSFLHLFRR